MSVPMILLRYGGLIQGYMLGHIHQRNADEKHRFFITKAFIVPMHLNKPKIIHIVD